MGTVPGSELAISSLTSRSDNNNPCLAAALCFVVLLITIDNIPITVSFLQRVSFGRDSRDSYVALASSARLGLVHCTVRTLC